MLINNLGYSEFEKHAEQASCVQKGWEKWSTQMESCHPGDPCDSLQEAAKPQMMGGRGSLFS